MKLTIIREQLLKPLQALISVVEKRHTMAILGNVFLRVENQTLHLTATDLEVEISGKTTAEQTSGDGSVTVPARKLYDIVRSLPEGAQIKLVDEKGKIVLVSGRSRFSLSSLPAEDFPIIDSALGETQVTVSQKLLAGLFRRTYFAMAQQDVRYFLNGMLLEVADRTIRVVATDGHRLAMSTESLNESVSTKVQIIIPRKAVLELMRLVDENSDDLVVLTLGSHHVRFDLPEYTFTSKLLDGRYPDYNRVVPTPGPNLLVATKEQLRHALMRTAILSNEKYRGVRMMFSETELKLMANNPEQEEAQDEVEVKYQGQNIEIGFNVSYLLDVLNAIEGETVKFALNNTNSSALIHDANTQASLYVVMPIRL